jgi:hypothetical protein
MRSWPFLAFALFGAAGCANGVATDDTASELSVDSGGADPDVSAPAQPASTEAGLPDSDTSDASNDAGGATDTGSPTDDAAPDAAPTACAAANTCAAATVIPQISGDTGNDTRTAQGTTSEWLQVLATEDDGSVFGKDLRVKATLTSPPGTSFALYLYRGPDAPMLACGMNPAEQSTLTSGTNSVSDVWPDNLGHTDSKIVTLEVRNVSGTCDATATWTLTVMGDTN